MKSVLRRTVDGDDTKITAVRNEQIDEFHKHLNKQNADIQFTKEIEENGKIPLLDCLVSGDNNCSRTTVCRKTHTDRLLDQISYNPMTHKATNIRTLTKRAQTVCDSNDSLTKETRYLNNVFKKNNYTTDFVKHNTYKGQNNNPSFSTVTTATIP